MRSFPFYVTPLLAVSLLSGCAKKDSPTDAPSIAPESSDLAAAAPDTGDQAAAGTDQAPSAPEARALAASSVAAFGTQLLDKARAELPNDNAVVSPWSVENALLIAAAGAEGETQAEMYRALGFADQSSDVVQGNAGYLARHLREASRERNDDGSLDDDSYLNTANAVWVDRGIRDQLLPTYAEHVRTFWDTQVHDAPFSDNAEGARQTINAWVEDETDDKIKNLIAPGVITPNTSLVITNAVHFDADWETAFDERKTSDQTWFDLNTSERSVQMMYGTFDGMETWSGDGYAGVRIPYEGGTFAMDIVLPDTGKFDEIRERVSASSLETVFNGERALERVDLYLPKFKFEYSAELGEALQSMGMVRAFGSDAQFGGMFANIAQSISAVIHKVYIDVDEEGTEAAAATAVVMTRASLPVAQNARVFRIDRPFLFAIRDVETGTPIFYGQITKPSVDGPNVP